MTPKTRRWFRFIVGGGINTAFTYGLYLAFNTVLAYQLSYFLAYVLGIIFAYWFNAVFVFNVQLSWRGFFSYPLVYVAQYGASALILGGLVQFVGVGQKIAPLIVTACMVPLTYVMSKVVLRWSSKHKNSSS